MSRFRVHELAKELNMSNKDLIDRLVKLGIQVKNHMSTLTDSAVQKIRQQFAEPKPEKVEETRVNRTVIRRRKRADEELGAESPDLALEPEAAEPEFDAPVEPVEPVEPPEAPVMVEPAGAEAPAMAETPVRAELHAEAEVPVKAPEPVKISERLRTGEPARIIAPAPKAPVETKKPASVAEPAPSVPKAGVKAPAVESPPEEEKPAIQPSAAAVHEMESVPVSEAPHLIPPSEEPKPPKPVAETTPVGEMKRKVAEETEPETVRLPVESVPEPAVSPQAVEPVEPASAEATEEEGEAGEETEEGKDKPKKAKKRRRKKARKDEPARIIKLPEVIIPEEVEEEPDHIEEIASTIKVKTEDTETKKRRTRAEEAAAREAERKKRGGAPAAPRKEVFEREHLYSKKELAAQADRGRGRDRDRGAGLRGMPEPEAPAKIGRRKIKIDEAISVANLAKEMGVKAPEVIKKLLLLGVTANINQALDIDTAGVVAAEFSFEVEKVGFEEEEILHSQEDRVEDMTSRPPVITVMGHVDHGKTSLLDAIRDTKVIEGEAGGITQHIGAYDVKLPNGNVVFLDTPGHEAFTSMRARGAKVTDIVILVVAADDGVMQQTVEAINHAKAAQVPIIVAINKVDKPNANVDRVKRELAEHALLPEEWGGNTTMVEISAKKRMGIEDLLEMVLLQAELLELRANPKKPARGRVIEAKLDKGRGPVATILIQEGTLKAGDIYVCGTHSGRVRNMYNDRGRRLETAGPATPVEVIGLSGIPNAGDDFIVLPDEKQAKMVAEHRLLKVREKELTRTSKVTLESLFDQIQEGEVKEVKLILKTDVHGSQEAIADSLLKLSTPEVKINLIHLGTGAITESDVMLASASNAIVIGFNVRSDAKVQELADQEKVDMRYYDVIYQVLSDVKDAMVGMLEPTYEEHVTGHAEVRQTFQVPKVGVIAGCSVTDGKVDRGAKVRVIRDGVVMWDGKLSSLKRFKDDVKEVKQGFECGMGIENFNDVKIGDIFEVYEMKEVKATLLIGDEKHSA